MSFGLLVVTCEEEAQPMGRGRERKDFILCFPVNTLPSQILVDGETERKDGHQLCPCSFLTEEGSRRKMYPHRSPGMGENVKPGTASVLGEKVERVVGHLWSRGE